MVNPNKFLPEEAREALDTLNGRRVTLTLTNAQIKSLPTTPIALTPVAAAGKLFVFARAIIVATFPVGYDAANADAALYVAPIWEDGSQSATASQSLWNSSGALGNGLPETNALDDALANGALFELQPFGSGAQTTAGPNVIAQEGYRLAIAAWNDGVDFTGGDDANKLTVTLFYLEV